MSSPPPKRLATAQALAYGRFIRPSLNPAVLRAQEKVRKCAKQHCKIQLGKGFTERGASKKLGDVYVKLMVIERAELREAFQSQSFSSAGDEERRLRHVLNDFVSGTQVTFVELAKMFERLLELDRQAQGTWPSAAATAVEAEEGEKRNDEESFRILLLASEGCGKTTLMTKYCPLQWALGLLWNEEFDFVIAREFRYDKTRRISGVGDLLGGWSSLGIEIPEDRQRIVDYVEDNPHRVCLILDGLDESKLSECDEFLQKVIRGEELCGIRLVVTSRPCPDVFTLSESHPFDRRVELVGFLPGDIPEFIDRMLGDESEKCGKLKKRISEDMYLASIMCTPYFATAICDLLKWRDKIPKCISDVFELMVLRSAESRDGKFYEKWEHLPVRFRQNALELGRFAFRMLVEQRLVFNVDDLVRCGVSDEAQLLGFLVACESDVSDDGSVSERQWRFSHLTLQEYFAALFVALSSHMFPGKVVCLVEVLGPRSGHLSTFWQLLAGHLDHDCVNSLLHAILEVEQCSKSEDVESMLLSFRAIPVEIENALCEVLSRANMEGLAEELLSGKVEGTGVVAVENELDQRCKSSNKDFLKTLFDIWTGCTPEANVEVLLNIVKKLNASAAAICQELLSSSPAEKCKSEGGMKEQEVNEESDTEYETKEEESGEEKQSREKLCFRCFMEHAQHTGDVNVKTLTMPSISLYLQKSPVYISNSDSPLNLLAVSYVVRSHRNDVSDLRILVTEVHSTDQDSAEHAGAASSHGDDFNADLRTSDYHGDLSSAASSFTRALIELANCCSIKELAFCWLLRRVSTPAHSALFANVIRSSSLSLAEVKCFRLVAPVVLSSLSLCQNLKFLYLSEVNDYMCLATVLQNLFILEELKISLSYQEDITARAVFQSLSGKQCLSSLTMNSFSLRYLHHLTTAITTLPVLKELVFGLLDLDGMTIDQEDAFLCAVQRCPKLRHVRFKTFWGVKDQRLLQQSSYPEYITLVVTRRYPISAR